MTTKVNTDYLHQLPAFLRLLRTDQSLLDDAGLVGVDGFLGRFPEHFSPQWDQLLPELRQVVAQNGGRVNLAAALPALEDRISAVLPAVTAAPFIHYLKGQVAADMLARDAFTDSPRLFKQALGVSAQSNTLMYQYAATLPEFAALATLKDPASRPQVLARYAAALEGKDPIFVSFSVDVLATRLAAAVDSACVVADAAGNPQLNDSTRHAVFHEMSMPTSSARPAP